MGQFNADQRLIFLQLCCAKKVDNKVRNPKKVPNLFFSTTCMFNIANRIDVMWGYEV